MPDGPMSKLMFEGPRFGILDESLRSCFSSMPKEGIPALL